MGGETHSAAACFKQLTTTFESPIHMVTIFVLIDALGWEYVKNSDLLPEVLSYRTEVQTVLGFSSGAIPTLLSGKLPRESGHWNLFLHDPQRSPFRWVRWLR